MTEVSRRQTVKSKNRLMNHVKNSLYSIRGDGDSGKGNVLKRLYLWYENKVEGTEIGSIMLDRTAVQVMAVSFI